MSIPGRTESVAIAIENAKRLYATREVSPYGGTETRYYDQSEPKRIHILGRLEPQLYETLFVACTGNWPWAEGEHLKMKILMTEWDELVPSGFETIFMYAVGTCSFPTCDVCWPNHMFTRPDDSSSVPYPGHSGAMEVSNTSLHHADLYPYATVPGDVFMRRGFSVFFPQLRGWNE